MDSINQQTGRTRVQSYTAGKPAIWLAITVAVSLHLLLLLLPLASKNPNTQSGARQIDLQLVTYKPEQSVAQAPALTQPPAMEIAPPVSEPESESTSLATALEPAASPQVEQPAPIKRDLQSMTAAEKSILTHTILSSQFITEESSADQLFGKQLESPDDEISANSRAMGFRIPQRSNLISMLNQPMPALPFEYSPGLVHFAYDPGVRGDLQRFWDVITPEFGWRTNNGTEFKCAWILVIAACGWN